MAILTTTTLDVGSETLNAIVLITVQNAAVPSYVTMTEAELLAQAASATPPRTDWNTDDVCSICSTAIGLPVTTS